MKHDVINLDGAKQGEVTLSEQVFGLEPRADLMHRVVLWQQAAQRQGTSNAKTRGEVARTGKKVYRQKGTGGARHASRSAPIYVGGGKAHGPRPRDFSFSLPKKLRALALRTALSSKLKGESLVVLDEAKMATPKTKELNTKLNKLELQNALVVVDALDQNFDLASRNLPHVKVIPSEGINVLDILRKKKLVLTKDAVAMLETRLLQRSGAAKAEKPAVEKKAAPKKAAAKKAPAKKAPAKKAAAKKTEADS